jgi:hypothetical protein
MDARGFIAVVMLVFLSLWGALYLEAGLGSYYVAELFFILLMIISSIGILYAIETKKRWAWHSLSAFFVIALANSALLYFAAGSRPGYAAFIFVNIAGVILGAAKAMDIGIMPSRERQGIPPPPVEKASPQSSIARLERYYERAGQDAYDFGKHSLEQKKKAAKKPKSAGKKKAAKKRARKKR